MNLNQNVSSLESSAADSAADAYSAIYDQLRTTVQQLVLTAVARARQEVALRPGRVGAPTPHGLARIRLSEREHEVLRHIAEGDSNKMIARALGLSPHTVKRHVANILDKLDARSRGQAAAWLLSQP